MDDNQQHQQEGQHNQHNQQHQQKRNEQHSQHQQQKNKKSTSNRNGTYGAYFEVMGLRNKRWGNQQRLLQGVILLLCFVLLLGACTKAAPEQASTGEEPSIVEGQTDLNSEPPVEEPPAPFATAFTGMPLEEANTTRPIAVMINNYAAARPQSGLTEADIIWEVLAEGGITRLVAIYQSTAAADTTIGPIRSIRPYLIELGEMYNGVLAHAGASNDGYAILQRQNKPYLDEISNSGGSFWRESFRKAPHNLYANLTKLREGIKRRGYEEEVAIPQMKFLPYMKPVEGAGVAAGANGATGGGTDGSSGAGSSSVAGSEAGAGRIDITFLLQNYVVSYDYEAAGNRYLRSINDRPHVDLNNEAQLFATNVVVLGTAHRTLDDVGRLAVDLSSGGPAILFQNGQAVEAQWVRPASDDMIRIVKDGEELPLQPGRTYYHIVPMTPSFEAHVKYE